MLISFSPWDKSVLDISFPSELLAVILLLYLAFNFIINGKNPGVTYYYTVPINVRTGATRTSTTNGLLWINETFLIDSHIHQFNGDEIFQYRSCGFNTTGFSFCSDWRQDNLDITNLPPSNINFLSPLLNSYWARTLNLSFTASTPYNNVTTITGYNVSLYSLVNTSNFNQSLVFLNSTTRNYSFNILNLVLPKGVKIFYFFH
jgi:hypothetical protein